MKELETEFLKAVMDLKKSKFAKTISVINHKYNNGGYCFGVQTTYRYQLIKFKFTNNDSFKIEFICLNSNYLKSIGKKELSNEKIALITKEINLIFEQVNKLHHE